MSRVAILGAGAWGRALAATAVRAHHQVSVWARNLEKWTPLKGNEGPLEVTLYSDLGDVLAAADGIIFALPAQTVRSFLTQNPLPVRPLLFRRSRSVEPRRPPAVILAAASCYF